MNVIDGSAFAPQWEQNPVIDHCAHTWETLHVRPRPGADVTPVQRCVYCGSPRCRRDNWADSPCTDRLHHGSLHLFEDGTFEPLGGYLPPENDYLPGCDA